jgi:Rrf2 family protein
MLSQTAQYALRTVVLIAAGRSPDPFPVEAIARQLGVPRNYLSKTLHQLARAGVLRSTRGPGGGFRLAVPAERLRLEQVVRPFDDIGGERRCLLGRPVCSERTACQAHARWKAAGEAVAAFFRDTMVADIIPGGRFSG